jgi:hypothetical protein
MTPVDIDLQERPLIQQELQALARGELAERVLTFDGLRITLDDLTAQSAEPLAKTVHRLHRRGRRLRGTVTVRDMPVGRALLLPPPVR